MISNLVQAGVSGRQTFLFLQSHPSSFAPELADGLERAGCRVLRVNFCVGDVIYWLPRFGIQYRGRFADWPTFLGTLIEREKITDILYYGDSRPYHRVAIAIAAAHRVRAYVHEFGYLRPDWITLERGGMSGNSHFPNDPMAVRAIGAAFPEPDLEPRHTHSIATELTHEIIYNLSSYFLHLAFPHYHSDRYYNPVIEYVTGIPRQLSIARSRRKAERVVAELVKREQRFFLFPLQLQNDYQLRHHADFAHQADAIRLVIGSFAKHAPGDSHLVFKCHPLDNGGEGWPDHVRAAADAAGVADRVAYIDGGNLGTLLAHAAGTVLINSTVGMHALLERCPLKAIGTALFDIPGLTHQGSLDDFWAAPPRPDEALVDAFVRGLAGTTQVKGSFLSKAGRAAAVKTFIERLTQGQVNAAGAFVEPPPRLAKRRSI